jgi:uncharacterized membrane protein YbaN (DUF454 family)
VEQALESCHAAGTIRPALSRPALPVHPSGPLEVATGFQRIEYLALAGGAFSLTLVGLIVPGVPTVPFLLATSYYLARSSPALNERLRRSACFGPILTEWELHHALSRSSKGRLIGLTLTVMAITLAITPFSILALVLIFAVSSLGIYGIERLPALSEEPAPQAPLALDVQPRFALPAP